MRKVLARLRRNGSRGLACNEIVELVTEYLDGAMDSATMRAFEEYLDMCEGCVNYHDHGQAPFASGSIVARVPLFLAILLIVRGVPALVFRRVVDSRRLLAASLLQATSLSFFVVVSQLGQTLGLITAANGAALVAAGLLSVLIFPVTGLTILRRSGQRLTAGAAEPSPA